MTNEDIKSILESEIKGIQIEYKLDYKPAPEKAIKIKEFWASCEPYLLINPMNKDVPTQLRMNKDNILYTAQQNTNDLFWSANARELGVKGTHETYNMLYNSDCNGEYFNTAQEALKAAELAVKKYKKGVKNPEYPNAEKWTSNCDVPDWAKVPIRDDNLNTMIIKDNRIVSDRTFANRLKNFLNDIRVSDPMSEEELYYLRRVADQMIMYQIDTVTDQREKDYLIRCNLISV